MFCLVWPSLASGFRPKACEGEVRQLLFAMAQGQVVRHVSMPRRRCEIAAFSAWAQGVLGAGCEQA